MDEQLIMERTGHRSNAVCAYKRTSSETNKAVSDKLHPPIPKVPRQDTDDLQSVAVDPNPDTICKETFARAVSIKHADGTCIEFKFERERFHDGCTRNKSICLQSFVIFFFVFFYAVS